jgi:ammonium transporter, Amt family
MQKSRAVAIFPGIVILSMLISLSAVTSASAYTENQSGIQYSCFQTDESTGDYLLDDEGNLIPCEIDHGDNAWMLTASALVLLMTPAGLAVFYSGLSRHKNAVSTVHMVFMACCLVTVQWVLWGYSLAFGPDATSGFIGNFDFAGLNYVYHDVPSDVYAITIPHGTFMIFQMMFAIITPALIVAALAERMKWSAFVVFVVIWATFVYDFAAHWTWSLGTGGTAVGWTGALPSLDFAGGTVIHITSGWAGLVIAIMLGRRLGYGKVPMEPHNIPLIVLGAALLWFGWFGFNAGSAGAAGPNATSAFVATQIATGTAALTWMLISWAHTGRPSTVGAASGAVAGLVAITPASGFVGPMAALIIGIVASLVCYAAVVFKNRRKWDDALDTWAVHGIGGLAGALLTGVFAQTIYTPIADGLAFGNPVQLLNNAIGAFAALAWAVGITALIIKVMDLVWPGGIRVTPKEEEVGLDLSQHGERAYVTE